MYVMYSLLSALKCLTCFGLKNLRYEAKLGLRSSLSNVRLSYVFHSRNVRKTLYE